jgi:tetratricopeptide (TPR) repeat protein
MKMFKNNVFEKSLTSLRSASIVTAIFFCCLGCNRSDAPSAHLDRTQSPVSKNTNAADESSAAKNRKERLTPIAEIAPAPLPAALPATGESGFSEDGYPTQYVDKASLRSLLLHERFSDLTKYFEEFQAAFEKNPRFEYWPIDAADAFSTAELSLESKLDAWAGATPDSFAPYLARGSHFTSLGYANRGSKAASETTGTDFITMESAMNKAVADLEKALAIRPKLNAAYRAEIQALLPTNQKEKLNKVIDKSAETCPECFQTKVTSMYALAPRWGGSYEQMTAFAEKAKTSLNPRFRLLKGYISIDKAKQLRKTDAMAARTELEKACSLGEHWEFLYERADANWLLKDYDSATKDLNRALELRPKQIDCLVLRARILSNQEKYSDAALDYLYAIRVNPTEIHARTIYDRILNGLIFEGWETHKAGRQAEAVRLFDMAADLAPNNSEVQQRKVSVVMNGKMPEPSDVAKYEAAVAASPDDLLLRRQLDYSIALTTKKFDRITASWTDYISRHPDDGRALVERGGAYLNMKKKDAAKQDFEKACDLGFSEGCGLLNKMK